MTKFLRTPYYMILMLGITLMAVADTGRLYSSGQLSSSLINCVVQDRYGYIWVGTEYGLNQFDGYHFTSFLHDRSDTTTISDNIITDFLVDRGGRLWIGSAKGLMRFDYHTHGFVRYPFPDGRRPRIYSLIESHAGDVLVGTAGFGLYSVRAGTDRLVRESQYARRDSDMFYTHLFEDGRRRLWQSSHLSTFSCFSRSGGRVSVRDFDSPCGAPVSFFQSSPHEMLIVCMGGILRYDDRTGRMADAGYDFGQHRGGLTINGAIFDHQGNLYLATSESGVLKAPRGSRQFRQLAPGSDDRFDLTTAHVKDLIEDKDHNLWFGCYRKGLQLVNDQRKAFSSWSFSEQGYTIGSSTSSLAEGEDGRTWCTVQNSGVYEFDATGRVCAHPASPAGTGIIYRDRRGQYWVGSGTAVYRYDPATGASQEAFRFTSDGTFCMADDGQGHLFVSVYSKGLYIYDVASRRVRVVNMAQQYPHGRLCNDWIRAMHVDGRGLLWMGTSNGVACLNTRTMAFDTYGWNSLLHNIPVNALCEDAGGNMVIGTDEGLYLFDRRRNRVGPFEESAALQGRQICGIVQDRSHDLWISTTQGIWQYDRRRGEFIGHLRGNGLRAQEYAQGAVLRTADDRIAFGMGDGLTTFYPEHVRANRLSMDSVYLTHFLIDGKAIDCLADDYSLAYSENSFTLQFSLLDYKRADDISYQYRINGGSWQATEEGSNTISFTKLEPGSYTIEVRAANNGAYSRSMRVLHIRVNHPWYSSVWAYIVYVLVAAGLGLLALHYYRRRSQAELEEAKMRFLIDATHDIRSPLTLIMAPLKKLSRRLAADPESQEDIRIIDRNAQRLMLLVNQILDERKIDKNQMHLHCQLTEMNHFVENICFLYRATAEEEQVNLRFTARQERVEAWIDRIAFDKVVSNLLSNALKYTPQGGEIEVVVGTEGAQLRLDVLDTGIGLKEERPERLFDRFYQGRNAQAASVRGTGIGLNLCRSIVQLHQGSIGAANRRDVAHGTVMTVRLPLGNAHLRPEEIMDDNTAEVPTHKPQASPTKNSRILIVDDDKEIGDYIRQELSRWYRFDYCDNGKTALKRLLTDDFDLVISDVKMPGTDGITLLKAIKANTLISDTPVILLTSKNDVDDRLEGLRRGADAYMAKPFNMDELHIRIDNLIDNRRRLKGKFSGAQQQADRLERVTVKGNDDALMERVMKSVNQHLADADFSVELLAEEVGLSRAQLHRKMKEMTGISTGEFIRNIRLEQAARLIAEHKINITQVAYSTGFSNQTRFSTVFKQHFGMTPTEYSERYKATV